MTWRSLPNDSVCACVCGTEREKMGIEDSARVVSNPEVPPLNRDFKTGQIFLA